MLNRSGLVAIEKPEECTRLKAKKRCDPADVPSAKERAPRQLELMLMLTVVTTLCEKR